MVIVGAISAGNESFVNALKAEIHEHALDKRIVFLGEREFSELPSLFKSTDIVAALSKTEGFGLTILEAMSSGAAVIATEAGAWPEIIEQGVQGWVVPIEDQRSVTSTLDEMLSQPDKIQAMGLAGREEILKNYTIQREAKRLCEVYEDLAVLT